MHTWLKLIGSAQDPITEWKEKQVGFRKKNMPGVRTGDHLVLYAPGDNKHIFALAEATGDPERDDNYDEKVQGSCRWKVSVEYLINLPIAFGVNIDEVDTDRRPLARSVRQQSHINLYPKEYESAKSKLQEKATRCTASPLADELSTPEKYPEGARRTVTINAYERSPQARAACIARHGNTCAVCGFNFAMVYGTLGEGFIHVHHIVPIAGIGAEYEIDPIVELIPICPNCHAMIHRTEPPLTVEYLRSRLHETKKNTERDGAANGSQPFRSETNGTSGAAGSRR